MHITRKTTCELISKATNGELSWEQIARAALDYMSEADVTDMATAEGFIPDEEEVDTNDEDND